MAAARQLDAIDFVLRACPLALSILGYAIVLPGRKSSYRAGFRPDHSRETFKIGPPTGPRPAGGPIVRFSRLESGRNPVRKIDFRPRSSIA